MSAADNERLNAIANRLSQTLEGEELIDVIAVLARALAFAFTQAFESSTQRLLAFERAMKTIEREMREFADVKSDLRH